MKRNSYVSFGAQGSSRPEVSPFVSYAYANEKLRFDAYVRYSNNVWKGKSRGEGLMYAEDSSQVRQYNSNWNSESRDNDVSVDFSLGYDFDSMNTLSAYVSLSPSWGNRFSDGRYEQTQLIASAFEDYSYSSHGDSRSGYFWSYGSAEFEHKFNNEGHQISFGVSGYGGGTLGSNVGTSWEHYDHQTHMNYDARTLGSENYHNVDFVVDYSYPYSDKGELNAGISVTLDGNSDYSRRDTLATDNLYHCDVLRSDTSQSPSVGSRIYLSWRRKFGDFTLRVGGNLKNDYSASRHLGLPQYDTAVNYWSVGPSLTLLYNTETMHSFSLNYSMYTSMPSASQMSRYVSYGTDNCSTGNSQLEPSYTHDFGLGYDKYFEQGHSIGVSASYEMQFNQVDYISMPTYSDFFGRYVLFSKPFNTGNSRTGNIYVYARWRPTAVFNLTFSISAKDSWYRVMLHPGEWMEDEMAGWNTRLYARAKLFNLVWVSVSGYYRSRSHGWSVLEIEEPGYGMDLGASADLFDRMLSFYINVNDVFNTANWNSTSINPYAPSTSNYTYNSQYITFGVTLRFGKMELSNSGREGIQESKGEGKGGK